MIILVCVAIEYSFKFTDYFKRKEPVVENPEPVTLKFSSNRTQNFTW